MTYAEALARLFARRRFGVRPGLERMEALLAALGRPERGLTCVHVTGSNGKGSTAAFAESLLAAGGARTGLFTSPHLHRFVERVRIDGRDLDEAEAAELVARALDAGPEATFFEVATAVAFLAFRAHAVQVAVVEVGLGGRLDSTNVLDGPGARVVTGVALEHTEILGATLGAIAREKAGIFRAGQPAIVGATPPEASEVLSAHARALGAPLHRVGIEIEAAPLGEQGLDYRGPGGALAVPRLGLAGAHQRSNAALALAAVALCPGAPPLDEAARRRGLAEVRWPGRLEWLRPDLLVDGAHNADGAERLALELRRLAGGRPVTLVLGVSSDKDVRAMLTSLSPHAARLIATRSPSPRALPAAALAALAPGAEPLEPLERALAEARRPGGLTVVAGSLFLVAEARRLVLGEAVDPISVQDPLGVENL